MILAAAVEVLAYFLFIRRWLKIRKERALQEAAHCITDPKLLDELASTSQTGSNYYELVIQGYQDFNVSLGYTVVFLFFPALFIGLFLAIPLTVPIAFIVIVLQIPSGIDAAVTPSFVAGQILAAALWYKLGYYRIYRRGRLKSMTSGGTIELKAPRPGKHK